MANPHRTLPNEQAPAAGGARAWLLAGALVLALNLLVAVLIDGTPSADLVAHKWRMLHALEQAPDGIVLGDSAGNQGIDTDLLSTATGQRWVNLCTHGNMLLAGDAWMLDELIARNRAPKHILLVHAYDVWSRGPEEIGANIAQIPLLTAPVATLPALPDGRTFDALALWYRLVPLAGRPLTARYVLNFPADGFRQRSYSPSGHQTGITGKRPDPDRDLQDHVRRLTRTPWSPSAVNLAALGHLLATARRIGAEVSYVQAPLYEQALTRPVFAENYARYRAFLGTIADANPWLHIDNGVPVLFPAASLSTIEHVDAAGSWILTGHVSRFLATRTDAHQKARP